MNELLTLIRRIVIGLVGLAIGLFVFLLALTAGLIFVIYTLLRGKRPQWRTVHFGQFGRRGPMPGSAGSTPQQHMDDVVDIEAREVPEDPPHHQRLDDSSSRISP